MGASPLARQVTETGKYPGKFLPSIVPKICEFPTTLQCFVTAAICLNLIQNACVIGYPAILLPQLHAPGSHVHMSLAADSWIASTVTLSMLVGNFMMPPISGRCGRKVGHIVAILPAFVGWTIFVFTPGIEMMLIGRVFQGLSNGLIFPLRSMVIGEYTSPKYRGAFLALVSVALGVGNLLVHLVGSFISWQHTALIGVFFAFVSLVMTLFSPESPSYLAAIGKYDKCRNSFHWLRGHDEDEELEKMIEACILQEEHKQLENAGPKQTYFRKILDVLKKKEFYKPVILMMHMYLIGQVSGSMTLAAYSTKILGLMMGPDANVNFWMVFLDAQRLLANIAASFFINKVKRRTMLFFSGSLCIIVYFSMAAYVYCKLHGYLLFDSQWIPIIFLNLHVFLTNFGLFPIPNVLAGEVFPLRYRGSAGSLSIFFMCIFMFADLGSFNFITEYLGLYGAYSNYAGLMAYALTVAWFMLPETKDRTLQDIEEEFRGGPLTEANMAHRKILQ